MSQRYPRKPRALKGSAPKVSLKRLIQPLWKQLRGLTGWLACPADSASPETAGWLAGWLSVSGVADSANLETAGWLAA